MLDQAPFRPFFLAGAKWELRADHRAWYTLDLLTKGQYKRTIRRFIRLRSSRLEPSYLLLWCLTATWRLKNRLAFPRAEEDTAVGTLVPLSFVATLPVDTSTWASLKFLVLGLLEEAELIQFAPTEHAVGAAPPPVDEGPDGSGAAQNPQPSQGDSETSPLTGPGAFETQSKNSD